MNSIQKLLIGASVIGMGAVSSTPAMAISISGATIGGSAPYLVYGSNATNTFQITNPTAADIQAVLGGNAASPTGNVELFSNSEKTPLSPSGLPTAFTALNTFLGYNQNTTLTGQLGTQSITLSSLNATDWFGAATTTVSNSLALALGLSAATPLEVGLKALALNNAISPLYNPANLATQWFSAALSTYGLTANQGLFNTFLLAGGFQRFSDPNISYVNQDAAGLVTIGLAGHYDASALLGVSIPGKLLQASELVKVTYGNNPAQYLYSFSATPSGLVSNDGTNSHNGNYEVKFQGVKPPVEKVPEPSAVLGLAVLGGMFTAKKKLVKA